MLPSYIPSETSMYSITKDEYADLAEQNINTTSEINDFHLSREIQVLKLQKNKITIIGEEISQFKTLKFLNISYNQIAKIQNLSSFSNLVLLDLSRNKIIKLENLENNVKLKRLLVSRNLIQSINFKTPLKSIILIDIHKNPIKQVNFGKFFPSLIQLYIDECLLTSLKGINTFSSLKHLKCRKNKINDSNNVILTHPFLEDIDISNNQMTTLVPFLNLSTLIFLNIKNNPLTDASFQIPKTLQNQSFIDKMPQLKTLIISNTKIQTLYLIVKLFPRIENVDISESQISKLDDVLQFVKEAKYLKFLDLLGNPLTKELYPNDFLKNKDGCESISKFNHQYSSNVDKRHIYRQEILQCTDGNLETLDRIKTAEEYKLSPKCSSPASSSQGYDEIINTNNNNNTINKHDHSKNRTKIKNANDDDYEYAYDEEEENKKMFISHDESADDELEDNQEDLDDVTPISNNNISLKKVPTTENTENNDKQMEEELKKKDSNIQKLENDIQKLNSKIDKLKEDRKHLSEQLEISNNNVNEFMQTGSLNNEAINERDKQISELRNKINQLNDTIKAFDEKYTEINDSLEKEQLENQRLTNDLQKTKEDLKKSNNINCDNQMKINNLQSLVETKDANIEEMNKVQQKQLENIRKISNENAQIKNELQTKSNENENKLKEANENIEKLSNQLKDKESMLESFKNNPSDSEVQKIREQLQKQISLNEEKENQIQALNSNENQMKKEIDKLKELLTNQDDEHQKDINKLQKNIELRKNESDELQSQIDEKDQEIQKLNKNLADQNDQILDLKFALSQKDKEIDKIKLLNDNNGSQDDSGTSELKNQFSTLLKEKENDSEQIRNLEKTIQKLKEENSNLKQTVDKEKDEQEKLNDTIKTLDQEKSDLNNQIEELTNKINSLNSNESEKAKELSEKIDQYENMIKSNQNDKENDILQLTKQLKDLQEKLKKSNEENQELSSNLTQKDEKIQGLTNNINQDEQKIQELTNNINQKDEKIQELKNNTNQKEEKIQELTNNINQKEEKIQELTNNINQKDEKIQELSNDINKMNEELKSIKQNCDNKINEYETKMNDLKSQNEKLKEEINQLNKSHESNFEFKNNNNEEIIQQLKKEIEMKNNSFSESQKENQKLHLTISDINKNFKLNLNKKKDQITMNINTNIFMIILNKLKENEKAITRISSKVNSLSNEIGYKRNLIHSLSSEKENILKSTNKKIEELSNLLSQKNDENKSLSAKIKSMQNNDFQNEDENSKDSKLKEYLQKIHSLNCLINHYRSQVTGIQNQPAYAVSSNNTDLLKVKNELSKMKANLNDLKEKVEVDNMHKVFKLTKMKIMDECNKRINKNKKKRKNDNSKKKKKTVDNFVQTKITSSKFDVTEKLYLYDKKSLHLLVHNKTKDIYNHAMKHADKNTISENLPASMLEKFLLAFERHNQAIVDQLAFLRETIRTTNTFTNSNQIPTYMQNPNPNPNQSVDKLIQLVSEVIQDNKKIHNEIVSFNSTNKLNNNNNNADKMKQRNSKESRHASHTNFVDKTLSINDLDSNSEVEFIDLTENSKSSHNSKRKSKLSSNYKLNNESSSTKHSKSPSPRKVSKSKNKTERKNSAKITSLSDRKRFSISSYDNEHGNIIYHENSKNNKKFEIVHGSVNNENQEISVNNNTEINDFYYADNLNDQSNEISEIKKKNKSKQSNLYDDDKSIQKVQYPSHLNPHFSLDSPSKSKSQSESYSLINHDFQNIGDCESVILKEASSSNTESILSEKSTEFKSVRFWLSVSLRKNIFMKSIVKINSKNVFLKFKSKYKAVHPIIVLMPVEAKNNLDLNSDSKINIQNNAIVFRYLSRIPKSFPHQFFLCATDLGIQSVQPTQKAEMPSQSDLQKIQNAGYDSFIFNHNGIENIMIFVPSRIVPLYYISI